MKDAIHSIVDDGYSSKFHRTLCEKPFRGLCAPSMAARWHRRQSAGLLAGVLDINASVKGARFVRSATPSTFRSSPSKMSRFSPPEPRGISRNHQATGQIALAFAEATVPKSLSSPAKTYGRRVLASWLRNTFGPMPISPGPPRRSPSWSRGAVNIVNKRELGQSSDPSAKSSVRKKSLDFRDRFANPFVGPPERGYIDAVIEPADRAPASSLLSRPRKQTRYESTQKHGNIPL